MLWVDIVIIAIVLTCSVVGIVRGLIGEILSLSVWLLATGIGLSFNREFSILLNLTLTDPAVRVACSFVGLLIITLLIGTTVCGVLLEVIKNTPMDFFNRFWAMVFGGLHGVMIVATLILLAGLSPLTSESWWNDALLIPPFQALAIFIRDHISSEMASYVHYH